MVTDQEISDARPARAAKAKSERATRRFTALFVKEYPRIVAFAKRRTGDSCAAEDIAADVFRIAWEQDETPGSAWLFVTARNLLRNHHRANARLAELHNRLRMERAAEPPAANDALLDAIETLPDSQRELLLAHYWDGLSGAECAALVGCSPGSVWVALHRARANLRRQLTKG